MTETEPKNPLEDQALLELLERKKQIEAELREINTSLHLLNSSFCLSNSQS